MNLSREQFRRVSEILQNWVGITYDQRRYSELERVLTAAARQLDVPVSGLVELVLTNTLDSVQRETLIANLTVGETYFFRNLKFYETVKRQILEPRAKSGIPFNFWSAGCCTGEEPYSVAILLFEAGMSTNANIYATDINHRFLDKARTGIYTAWSLRDVPESIKSTYFHEGPGARFHLVEQIRWLVHFSRLNLKDDRYPVPFNLPNTMDLIFFRNVLMYFDTATVDAIVDRFCRILKPGGWLAVGASEVPFIRHPDLLSRGFGTVKLFQKRSELQEKKDNCHISRLADTAAPENTGHDPVDRGSHERCGHLHDIDSREIPTLENALELFASGKYEACRKQLDQLLAVPSQSAETQARLNHLMGLVLARLGELEQALEYGQRAVEMDRLNPDYRYFMATVTHSLGRREMEKQFLDQTLYLDPDHVPAHVQLAGYYGRQGRQDLGEKHRRCAAEILSGRPSDAVVEGTDGLCVAELQSILEEVGTNDGAAQQRRSTGQ